MRTRRRHRGRLGPRSTLGTSAQFLLADRGENATSWYRQGDSGLGLEAQEAIVRSHLKQVKGRLVAEYTDVMSGRKRHRPELARAIHHASNLGATLIVAKLDRLARNASFLLELCDGQTPVHFCDLPSLSSSDPAVSRMILTIMASFAEFESRRIGQRIRDAYAAARARGKPIKTGLNTRQHRMAIRRLSLRRKSEARAFSVTIRELLAGHLERGCTLLTMAEYLNRRGIWTVTGCRWSQSNVWRVLAQI